MSRPFSFAAMNNSDQQNIRPALPQEKLEDIFIDRLIEILIAQAEDEDDTTLKQEVVSESSRKKPAEPGLVARSKSPL